MKDTYEHTDLCAGCEHMDACSYTGHGCEEYRRRFIEWWDTNIHRSTEPKEVKEYFRYKHPDEKEE